MKLVPLNQVFHVEYGNQFDLNKMEIDPDGVSFVSRSKSNLGVVTKVKPVDKPPYPAGLITVSLGGSLLSSFVQQSNFYTGQNIKVLLPRQKLTTNEKIFYCLCIYKNHFKYSALGREANKSLDTLAVPSVEHIPKWVATTNSSGLIKSTPLLKQKISLLERAWHWFKYDDLFNIVRGRGARKAELSVDGIS